MRASRRIRVLERALASLGYSPGTVDGTYGPSTQSAVAQFQAGKQVEVRFEHRPDVRDSQARFATMRLGITPQVGDEVLIEEATPGQLAGRMAA